MPKEAATGGVRLTSTLLICNSSAFVPSFLRISRLSRNHIGEGSVTEPCYQLFKSYLDSIGFTVYPIEFDCGNSRHPLVDIVARMGSFYWAFEYKSKNDSISTGVDQVACYSDWFDYVVLVSERWIDHTRSTNFWKLASFGAGIWNFLPSSGKLVEIKNPSIQSPDKKHRRTLRSRFEPLKSRSKNSEIYIGLQARFFESKYAPSEHFVELR